MKIISKILLVLTAIILLELTCQVVFLFYGEKKYSILLKPFSDKISKLTINDYKIDWDYKKNKMKPGIYNHKGIQYTINSKGFRGREFDLIKNKKRIITFGGSTTAGLESPDDKTYPAQLELLLNKSGKNYEVINMGFSSKSLNFIKSLLFTEAYKYKADVIIIYSNRNSIMYDGSYVDSNLFNNKLIKINFFLQENIMIYRLMFKVYKRYINFNLDTDYLKSPFSSKGVNEKYLLDGYKNSLIEIINFSKKNNIQVILAKQAYFFTPNIIDEIDKFSVLELIENYKKDFFLKKYSLKEEENFFIILGAILNKKLDELKNFENVTVVNPIPELIKSKSNFTDYLHLTPEGNFTLANEIYKSFDKAQ
jgi:lysophospholipase L1-like esterase